jgi:hypothetical protein
MSEFGKQASLIEIRAAHTEDAHRSGGILHRIASSAIQGSELGHRHVGDIILPPKQQDEKYKARWELLEGAKEIIKAGSMAETEAIYQLAEFLDIRKPESISESDIARIDPQKAVWMAEGGANRTSVVRRQLAFEAIQKIYGEQAPEQAVYQFGSDRAIPRQRNDQPNAEYSIAQEIAGDFLPKDDSLTEFDLNVASAQQAGYELVKEMPQDSTPQSIERLIVLQKTASPRLVMVQPKKDKGGLVDGIHAAHELVSAEQAGMFLAEPYFQPVIATNGQYRAKDEHQAVEWSHSQGIAILPPVALGDEPGFSVRHNGKEIVTAERPPMVYVNEMVILHRLNS